MRTGSWCDMGWYPVSLMMILSLLPGTWSGEYTLTMVSESSCTKTHFYKEGDIFTASAKGRVYDGSCSLKFLQSGMLQTDSYVKPCYSLCVRLISYTNSDCNVKMSYHDGVKDYNPVTFDCHTHPPVLWCSSDNELIVTVKVGNSYEPNSFAFTLEVKPFCGSESQITTDPSVVVQPRSKQSSMSHTAVIIGAVFATVSILFVLCWLIYHQRNRARNAQSNTRPERNERGGTPCQPVNRYCPIERKPPSSQSSSDRGVTAPPKPDLDTGIQNNLNERRLYSPFQPPMQKSSGQQQVLYSDLDHGQIGGAKWYNFPGGGASSDGYPPAAGFRPPPSSQKTQSSQYMLQNQVYKYPQFNNGDREMHTVPTDTRFVVYDFDYEQQPIERKYSAGKMRTASHRDSPIKDYERQRPREITPLRETIRVVAPVESNTDQTSENEDSSVSGTTEDDTTDDQMPRYHYGFFGQPGLRPGPGTKVYDASNFQRQGNPPGAQTEELSATDGSFVSRPSDHRSVDRELSESVDQDSMGMNPPAPVSTADDQPTSQAPANKEGPMPQVPPIPKDFQRSQMSSPTRQLPWPHDPPPPYTRTETYHV